MKKTASAPYVHTEKTNNSRAAEWLVALVPVLIWSVYMFGARVISICLISAVFSLLFDWLIRSYILKLNKSARLDSMAAVYGALTAFAMPVAVPLWLPTVGALLTAVAKNIKGFRAKRLFNPFVFSAAALNIFFGAEMTAFTRPSAYFGAFDITIDERLLSGYRVLSPLQFMADGSVYEDGVLAQLYGYASGNIGEIAITAMIISLIWLCARKEADWRGAVALAAPVFLLALLFPSDDAESEFFAYSTVLSGAIAYLSVFAMNENHTVPMTRSGRIIFGFVCGCAVFYLHRYYGGFEWGYFVILAMNVISPFIEAFTKPKAIG